LKSSGARAGTTRFATAARAVIPPPSGIEGAWKTPTPTTWDRGLLRRALPVTRVGGGVLAGRLVSPRGPDVRELHTPRFPLTPNTHMTTQHKPASAMIDTSADTALAFDPILP